MMFLDSIHLVLKRKEAEILITTHFHVLFFLNVRFGLLCNQARDYM